MVEAIKRPHVRNGDQYDALDRRRYARYRAGQRSKIKRGYRRLERRLGKQECGNDYRQK